VYVEQHHSKNALVVHFSSRQNIMTPVNKVPSPGVSMSPTTPQDKIKAEARAYALSSPGNKRKQPNTQQEGSASKALKFDVGTTPSRTSSRLAAAAAPSTPNENLLGELSIPNSSSNNNTTPLAFKNATGMADEDDDEYLRFVQSLGIDETLFGGDDDEEYQFIDGEEEDDDDDEEEEDEDGADGDHKGGTVHSSPPTNAGSDSETPSLSSPLNSNSPLHLPDLDSHDFGQDLEEELGSLLEEDLEAAVATLLTNKKPTQVNASTPASVASNATTPSPNASVNSTQSKTTPVPANGDKGGKQEACPATPLRDAARHRQTPVTPHQSQQLRSLMTQHYQILTQQAILSVRAAQSQKIHRERSEFLCGETADDLAEILDGAVGMLQDLDQVRTSKLQWLLVYHYLQLVSLSISHIVLVFL
jgi:hypothetical protein